MNCTFDMAIESTGTIQEPRQAARRWRPRRIPMKRPTHYRIISAVLCCAVVAVSAWFSSVVRQMPRRRQRRPEVTTADAARSIRPHPS